MPESVFVLLICDHRRYLEIEKLLSDTTDNITFQICWSDFSPSSLPVLETQPDIILLACALSKQEDDLIQQFQSQVPGIPIVVVVEEEISYQRASKYLRKGAQDVLDWNHLNSNLLMRSLIYAIDRQKVIRELQEVSWFDELTGLHNRRSFLTLARHHLKVCERSKSKIVICFVDLDNMKWINDHFGHQAGDKALIDTANILRQTFRSSDVIARFGGDEFVVLAVDADFSFADSLTHRLNEKVLEHSDAYPFSLSIGFVYHHSGMPCTIEELIAKADENMYEQKRSKNARQKENQKTVYDMPCIYGP